MKNLVLGFGICILLSSCALFRPHKIDIEQGNVITSAQVAKLHVGMTEVQVLTIMGDPLLVNLFTPNRMEYVYTFQEGYQPMHSKQVSCIFVGNVLRRLQTKI